MRSMVEGVFQERRVRLAPPPPPFGRSPSPTGEEKDATGMNVDWS